MTRSAWITLIFSFCFIASEASSSSGEWSARDYAYFFYRLPSGDFWEEGIGGEVSMGRGTESISLHLALGIGWQNTDDQEMINRIRPHLPTDPKIEDWFPFRLEVGPSIWLSHRLSELISISTDIGIRGVWQFGPSIIYKERVYRSDIDRRENVEFDIGIVARLGANVQIGPKDKPHLFVGVGYDAQVNSPKAKYEGNVIGDAGYDSIMIRIGARTTF